MGADTALQYVTGINAAGQSISCVESYESVLARMRDAEFKTHAESDDETGSWTWAAPIELTVQGPGGRPLRAAFALHAITSVIELREEDRTEVVMDDGE